MSIFSYLNYVDWLLKKLKEEDRQHGAKRRWAEAAECQASYLTLVLKGKADFTLEHAERLCRFWQLSPEETEYFILLVSFARAGSAELRKHYRQKITSLQEASENLGKRIKNVEIFPDAEAAIYYSSWHYLAIHILISIPEFQTVNAISDRLQIDEVAARKALQYLQQLGFAVLDNGRWKSTGRQLHLPRESTFVSLHHSHWRRRAVDSSFAGKTESLHYTAINSLAQKDIEIIKQLALKLIDASREVIGPSPEEEVVCLAIDVFKV